MHNRLRNAVSHDLEREIPKNDYSDFSLYRLLFSGGHLRRGAVSADGHCQ